MGYTRSIEQRFYAQPKNRSPEAGHSHSIFTVPAPQRGDDMNEREQLEQAIAALESQRAILGDAIVHVALAPMREKLAALSAQQTPAEQQRKQLAVLFADVSGFTAMSETMDPE